ncbi:MAG: hypothetical protein ACK5MF_05805 [Vibrio sp.]|uniref:hypothetical protein n=1 Tax=Vibrio sp. TaxID=678 RepID=UPI003A8BC355
MNQQILLERVKQMLAAHISVCTDRKARQVLDLLLENYPQDSCIKAMCSQLGISQTNLLHSILRNARIFIEIDTLYTNRKPTHLAIGKQIVKAVKCQCLLNMCFCNKPSPDEGEDKK